MLLGIQTSPIRKEFSIVSLFVYWSPSDTANLDVEPDKFWEVAERLTEFKEVKYIATSTGDHRVMIEIWAKDGKELTKLISDKLGKIEGVNRICPAIILEKVKSV